MKKQQRLDLQNTERVLGNPEFVERLTRCRGIRRWLSKTVCEGRREGELWKVVVISSYGKRNNSFMTMLRDIIENEREGMHLLALYDNETAGPIDLPSRVFCTENHKHWIHVANVADFEENVLCLPGVLAVDWHDGTKTSKIDLGDPTNLYDMRPEIRKLHHAWGLSDKNVTLFDARPGDVMRECTLSDTTGIRYNPSVIKSHGPAHVIPLAMLVTAAKEEEEEQEEEQDEDEWRPGVLFSEEDPDDQPAGEEEEEEEAVVEEEEDEEEEENVDEYDSNSDDSDSDDDADKAINEHDAAGSDNEGDEYE